MRFLTGNSEKEGDGLTFNSTVSRSLSRAPRKAQTGQTSAPAGIIAPQAWQVRRGSSFTESKSFVTDSLTEDYNSSPVPVHGSIILGIFDATMTPGQLPKAARSKASAQLKKTDNLYLSIAVVLGPPEERLTIRVVSNLITFAGSCDFSRLSRMASIAL